MIYNMSLYVRGPKTALPGEDSGLLVLLYRVSQKLKFPFSLSGDGNVLVRCIEISSFPLSLSAVRSFGSCTPRNNDVQVALNLFCQQNRTKASYAQKKTMTVQDWPAQCSCLHFDRCPEVLRGPE